MLRERTRNVPPKPPAPAEGSLSKVAGGALQQRTRAASPDFPRWDPDLPLLGLLSVGVLYQT